MPILREGLAQGLNTSNSVPHRVALIGLLLMACVVRVLVFQGYSDSDPRAYAILADELSRGFFRVPGYDGPPVFPFRIALYGPTAVLIHLFGLSEVTLAAYPFLMSVAGCVLAYAVTLLVAPPLAALVATALIATMPFDARMASLLFPDVIAATWANAGLFLVVLTSRSLDARRSCVHGALAGVCFSISWLCKEAVVYLAPIVLLIVILMAQRQTVREIAPKLLAIGVIPILVLGAEALVYANLTNDPLFRLHETERNYKVSAVWFFEPSSPFHGWNDDSFYKTLIKRLFWSGPKTLFLDPSMAYIPVTGLVAAAWALVFKDRRLCIIAVWFAAVLLAYNFMSTSFAEYKPLVLFDRYLYPIFLPSLVLTSALIGGHLSFSGNLRLAREKRFWATIILLFLLANNFTGLLPAASVRPQMLERAVSKYLDPRQMIFSDYRTAANLVFFRDGLLAKSSSHIQPWESTSLQDLPTGAYVLINSETLRFITTAYKYARPEYASSPPETWKKVYSTYGGDLYRVQ
jgi:hypothetical protein